MAARINSVDLLCGPTVFMIAPAFYNSSSLVPNTAYADQDLGGGDATIDQALDTNGYRGALITIHHSPRAASSFSRMRFRHGPTSDWTQHVQIGEDEDMSFIRAGQTNGGFPRALTVLVDVSRFDRYLSITHTTGGNQYVCVTGTPVIPIQPSRDQLDRTTANTNLFITGTGELSFPAIDPGA